MENKFEEREKKEEEEEAEKSPPLPLGVARGSEKAPKESKREAVRLKKTYKKERNGHKKPEISASEHPITPNPPEQESSALKDSFRSKKQKITSSLSELITPYSLEKLIHKPPYLTIARGNRLIGDYGHSTAIFKRPVIEGHLYMEFQVKEDAKKDKKASFSSAVRIGICAHYFNPSFPLGYGQSLAYKSVDGSIVTRGEKVDSAPRCGAGDVIGICMNISPPHKVPKPEEIHEGSSVTFFKNGQKVNEFRGLRQIFYCFAVSLYNYGTVEVVGVPQIQYRMRPEAKHYFSILNEKIPYKDLETKRIFKL